MYTVMSGTFKDLKCYQRGASVSVMSNIAEGKGRSTEKDLIRFLAAARGSLFEIEAQIALAEKLSYIDQFQSIKILALTSETGKLNGLIRSFDPSRSQSNAAPDS